MRFFDSSDEMTSTKWVLLLMAVAYAFSVAIRLIWVYQFSGNESFMWNAQLMINTNDGYYFASAAQKYLEGTLEFNPRVPGIFFTAAITLSAAAAKFLPISLDTAILYMPAVISGLVVIPMILIGRLIGSTAVGFLSALVGSIAWSYYNRTMVGYFDTDMFSAMAPMFILYFLLATLKTEKMHYALLSSIAFLLYPYLYDQGRSVVYAMGLMYMGYMLIFHRRDDFTYYSILLISVGLMKFNIPAQFVAIIAVYYLIHKRYIPVKTAMGVSVATVLLFLYSGNVFGLIETKVMKYAFRGVESEGLHFYQVQQTVREAGKIPFSVFADRISGSIPGLILALIGYIVLVIRHREMILALPLIGIGVFALFGGLRFTVYAVPAAALGAVYLFSLAGRNLPSKALQTAITAALTAMLLYPNITHIIDYKVPTVLSHTEVTSLQKLKAHSTSRDYVISWWDYGYPVWYYADKNTLIDGGKHSHDNFIVSEILTTDSQLEAARLGRIAVETYVDSDYRVIADTLFKNGQPDQLDPNAYLETLKYGDVALPEATRDIYLYLPFRMMDIFPTVALFSQLDLNTGHAYRAPFFYASRGFNDRGDSIDLGGGIRLLKKQGAIEFGGTSMPIRSLYTTQYDRDGSLKIDQQLIDFGGRLNVVFLKSYNRFLVLDDATLNSLFVQLFVFEKYDHDLFEPVVMDPLTKIYRLKR